jgi:hypothetical protein
MSLPILNKRTHGNNMKARSAYQNLQYAALIDET